MMRYASIDSKIRKATAGDDDSALQFTVRTGGTTQNNVDVYKTME